MKKAIPLIIGFLSCFLLLAGFLGFALAADTSKVDLTSLKSVSGIVKDAKPVKTSAIMKNYSSRIQSVNQEYLVTLEKVPDYDFHIDIKLPIEVDGIEGANFMPSQLAYVPSSQYDLTYSQNQIKIIYDKDSGKINQVKLIGIKPNSVLVAICIVLGLGVGVGLFYLFGGKKLYIGLDNRYSNSKIQLVMWTFLIISSYVALVLERYYAGPVCSLTYSLTPGIPSNLLILMGFSSGSFVLAKAITTSKKNTGKVMKLSSTKGARFSDLFSNDFENTELADAQMFAWTLVAVVVYIFNSYRMLVCFPISDASLPNVDSTLLDLTGISLSVYLAKKYVTNDKPQITGIDPDQGKPGESINIQGGPFGEDIGALTLGSTKLSTTSWGNISILADIPETMTEGKYTLTVTTKANDSASFDYTVAKGK
jgi:IPT/TIG domain